MTINAVIWDMDGVLVDSEPFWRQAEISVFPEYGIPMDDARCQSCMGMRIDQVVEHWKLLEKKPGLCTKTICEEIENRMVELIRARGEPMVGVQQALDALRAKDVPMVIASSSSSRLIAEVAQALDIQRFFKKTFSAENLKYGKPHPQVFLDAIDHLQLPAQQCLIVEDSVFGVIAARAASAQVLAIPDNPLSLDQFAIAHHVWEQMDSKKLLQLLMES